MSRNSLKLKVAYLYPDILKGFCDKANVQAFVSRATWRDIDVSVSEICANDRVQASKFDFYFIGGRNVHSLELALHYMKDNAQELTIASIASVPMLAVGCGYHLFGNYYQLHNRPQVQGLGILDVDFIASKKNYQSNLIGVCDFLKNKTVVGYENHGILAYLKTSVSPFLKVQAGIGNNAKDRTEGARYNNVIGTNIISPILPQNPHLCDFLISVALRIKYKCRIPLAPLCDDIEWYSHNYILEAK